MQTQHIPRIRWLFLTLSMLILILTLNPILVRADANGTHVDADGRLVVRGSTGSSSYDGGGAAKTGWLVYLVSAEHASKGNEGNTISAVIKSDVVYVDCQSSLPAGAYTTYLTPKISQDLFGTGVIRVSKWFTDCPWGTPFISNEKEGNRSRQPEIRAYMEEKVSIGGMEVTQAAKVVKAFLGEEAFDLFTQERSTTYLVLEPCTYHTALAGFYEGYRLLATGTGWSKYQAETAYSSVTDKSYFTEYGEEVNSKYPSNYDTSWVDNREIQQSCMLEERWIGLPYAPLEDGYETDNYGRISNKITNCRPSSSFLVDFQGFSMLAYKLQEQSINTYDPSNGSPGDPEDPVPDKVGESNIVKGYYEEDITTGEKRIVGDGVYHETKTTHIINILDEPGFSIVNWEVTNSFSTTVNPISWNPPGSTSQSGTSSTQVTLESPETTVYYSY